MQGTFTALVTGPMQKSVVNDAGIPFSGHTEYLADAAGADDVVMLLMTQTLKVAATTHLPLADVSGADPGAVGQTFAHIACSAGERLWSA